MSHLDYLDTVFHVNVVHIKFSAQQAAAPDRQFKFCIWMLNVKLSCQHVV